VLALAPWEIDRVSSDELLSDRVLDRVPTREGYKVLGGIALYERLGNGRMGVVYRGRHVRLGVDHAVKVMTPPSWLPPQLRGMYVSRLQREARIAAAINHPNLVRVVDVNSEGDAYFLVMEFVDGETALERVRRKGPLDAVESARICLAAAEGLAAAHHKRIVHRDVKPDNIMIAKSGHVFVADLGLAKACLAGSEAVPQESLTGTQDLLGTPQYMPLEQFTSAKSVGPQADVYSLGVTLYKLLTGEVPWESDNVYGLIAEMQKRSPRQVRDLRPDVPGVLVSVIDLCLRKKADERYPDCSEMAKAVRAALIDLGDTTFKVVADPEAGSSRPVTETMPPPATSVLDAIASGRVESPADPMGVTAVMAPSISVEYHKCPLCGKRNKIEDTFECRSCLRDHLCVRHLDESANECSECAEASSRRQAEKERRARETQERKRQEKAAVRAAAAHGRLRGIIYEDWPFNADEAARRRVNTAELLGIPRMCAVAVGEGLMLDAALVPAGVFVMGGSDDDRDRNRNEAPRHEVEITRPFYLGVYPVTQAQYHAVTGENPSRDVGHDVPVNMVSWLEAEDYCAVLSRRCGLAVRLPTEAGWEYACRAGCAARFSFGQLSMLQYMWYSGNAEGRAHSVGTKRPNAWGLYDMHGNVWEWCADWYSSDYYGLSDRSDPGGPEIGDSRVMRGGGYRHSARRCRSSNRDGDKPDARHPTLGFRVAIDIGTGALPAR